MNTNTTSIFKALGYAVIGLVLINLVYFLIAINSTEISENWSFAFKHGVFSLNEKLTGIKLWSVEANVIMVIIFFVTLIRAYFKGNLTLKPTSNKV
jgi:uncharacterized membrane protein YjfL (UPF0719 family)